MSDQTAATGAHFVAGLLVIGLAASAGGQTDPGALAVEQAAEVMARQDPAALEAELWQQPERVPPLYETFGEAVVALEQTDPDAQRRLIGYAMAVAARRAHRLAETLSPPPESLSLLAALLQIEPRRFHLDQGFRDRVAAAWPGALGSGTPAGDLPAHFRERLVERLAALAGGDLELLEPAAVAWDVARRATATRQATGVELDATDDDLRPIEASFFSASAFLGAGAVASLVESVRLAAPERRILVLAATGAAHDLASRVDTAIDLLPTLGVDYSPWPRDPMTWLRRADGGLHVVLRGNVQRGRETDLWMGRAWIQGLPDDLDAAWGQPTWERSEQPFHNGQILDAGGVSWVGIHSLEPRILELLGLDRVPVDRFAEPEGVSFVDAAHRAAADLAELRRRPVRFVHDLPGAAANDEVRAANLRDLGGGAGVDLDSVLTLLPPTQPGQPLVALVADVDAGTELLRHLPDAELAALSAYGLAAGPDLRQRLLADHATPAAAALDRFLERVAEHLAGEGMTVGRLPLLRITDPFLVTWNNVVLERRDGTSRAEGFASLLPSADDEARRAFADAGYALHLHPPLVESVLRGGGFRCASQHVRTAAGPEPRAVDSPADGP